MARILIGADLCPIGENAPFFVSGDSGALFHDLLDAFEAADLVIANLECPFIEAPTPIEKTGPVFGASGAAVNGIRAAGIDVLCLANNHILDHGAPGLLHTIEVCTAAGIATVGAGPDRASARRILVARADDVRVGVLAMAEHEFSVAGERSAGANFLDVIDFVRNVESARETFDFLVVLLHGGPEFLSAPSPRLKDTCRFFVEMGANAVVVQHPHSLGGYETYRGSPIVYGQGALVMDEAVYRTRRSFHEGVLIELTVATDGTSSMQLVPFVQSAPVPGARRMDAQRAEPFLHELARRSQALLDDDYVREEWRRYCEEHKHGYLGALLGHGRLLRRANRNGWLTHVLYKGRRLLGTRNVVCCETHREALGTIFTEGMF